MGFLERLRTANIERDKEVFKDTGKWSNMQWGCAIAGEVGELCNILKKQERGDSFYNDNACFSEIAPIGNNHFYIEVSKEIADILIYLDIFCHINNINIEMAVTSKFNEVSKRVGSTVTL